MSEYIGNPLSGKLRGVTYEDGKIIDVHIRDTDDVVKVFVPVRHGRWVSVPHKLVRVCSVCNRDEPYKFADIDADVYDYCPNCGARMDEEADHAQE